MGMNSHNLTSSTSHGRETQGDHFHGPIHAQAVGGRGNVNIGQISQINLNIASDSEPLCIDPTQNGSLIQSTVTVFNILKPYLVEDALYNSETRKTEHATTCHPDTHARILREVAQWFNSADYPLCWLRGPAGTGKSTICHTTAAELQQAKRLAATFFFSRKKGAREDVTKLIPTLAYQIAQHLPSTQLHMQRALQEDRTLLSQTMEYQFQKLIAEPVRDVGDVRARDRTLVIIDGLDECAERNRLLALVKLLGETFTSSNSPLQFLLASRPEPDITSAFRMHAPNKQSLWVSLEDSRGDVRRYLRHHLQQIRQQHETVMAREPPQWPPRRDLDTLVDNSDGLMIYAATLVRYLNDQQESPQVKLHKVLTRHDGVDPLYEQVISDAQEHPNFNRVLGTLIYLRYPIPLAELAQLLRLDVPTIRISLARCHSVLAIPDNDEHSIRPHHASLRDYLTDQERSKNLFCDPAQVHASIAVDCLRAITDSFSSESRPTEYVVIAWYYHCCKFFSHITGDEHLRLCRELKAEVVAVNIHWLEFWMVEALTYAGGNYVKVELPPTKVSESLQLSCAS